jgi:cobalt-zinc-cadmium efflux system protein
LSRAFALTSAFFLVELAGGWWTGSLALVADAVHMGIDVVALGVSLFAAKLSLLPPDSKRTFGYKRVEVLAALGNGVALLVATGIILGEAWHRWDQPSPVLAGPMLVVAVLGLACNVASGLMLYKHSHNNINLRGAFLHVVSDALGSLAAIVSAGLILAFGWQRADSAASALICAGIIFTSLWLIRDSVHILLEGAPSHLDLEDIRKALAQVPGVREVHDLHLWSLSKGSESMSGHLVLEPGQEPGPALSAAKTLLQERFSLTHVTLQLEGPANQGEPRCSD